MKSISEINTNTPEGRYLMAALAKLTTESQTDKTPDEVLKQCVDLSLIMYTKPTYARGQFEGFTHRFKVQLKTDLPYPSNIDIYSNSDSYEKLEDYIYEKKSDKVISFKIIHRASKEDDEMSAKLIDEVLKGI